MKYKYSIKTADGDRFQFERDTPLDVQRIAQSVFNSFPIEDGTKYFNTGNIVSITERIVDE